MVGGSVFFAVLTAVLVSYAMAQEIVELTAYEEITPYIIFATSNAIYRSSLTGTDLRRIVRERHGRITALDYSYRLDHMYWAVEGSSVSLIKQAWLNGTDQEIIPMGKDIRKPTGVAVDWMNNKLYWADRELQKIEQYDLEDSSTNDQSVVIDDESTEASMKPFSLAILPLKFPEPSLLAWTDQTQHTLESVASTGEQREVITTQNGRCGPGPLTADYSTHKIYWLDYCSYTIKAMTMDTHEILNIAVGQTTEVTPASTGIVSFRGSVYWAKLKNLYHFDGNETTTYTLNIDGTSSVTAMQIVHPSRQPIENEIVTPICENGCSENAECVASGECVCKEGFTGEDCAESTTLVTQAPSPEASTPPTTATAVSTIASSPAATTTPSPATTAPQSPSSQPSTTIAPTTAEDTPPTTTTPPPPTPPSTTSSPSVVSADLTTGSVVTSVTTDAGPNTATTTVGGEVSSDPPTQGVDTEDDTKVHTGTAVLIALFIAVPCIVIAVIALIAGIIYRYRKVRKQGSWSPNHPDSEAQLRTTFRLLDEPGPHLIPPPIRQQRRPKPRYTIGTAGSEDSQSFDIQLGDSLLSVREAN